MEIQSRVPVTNQEALKLLSDMVKDAEDTSEFNTAPWCDYLKEQGCSTNPSINHQEVLLSELKAQCPDFYDSLSKANLLNLCNLPYQSNLQLVDIYLALDTTIAKLEKE